MNIIRNLEQAITERLTETKNPCKGYSTYEAADKAGNDMAEQCGKLFDTTGRSSRYVVFFHEGYGKFVAAIDMSELLARNTAMGWICDVSSIKRLLHILTRRNILRELKFRIEKNIPHWLRAGDVSPKDTFAHIEFRAGKSKADNHTWLELDAEEGYMNRYNKPIAKRVMLQLNLAQMKELRALLDDMITDA